MGRFCVTGGLDVRWKDERLTWDPIMYGGIGQTKLKVANTWTPPIVLSNAYDAIVILGFNGAFVDINSDGNVTWKPKQVLESSCEPDITFFPFDRQNCRLDFALYGYDMNEMALINDLDINYNAELMPNSGWDILKSSAKVVVNRKGFQNLRIEIDFDRRSSFYIVGLLFPMISMSILNLFTFAIPQDVGGRVEYSTTILLTTAVFITTVTDSLPQSSLPQVSLVCFLVVCHLLLSALILVASILGSRLHVKTDADPIPFICSIMNKCCGPKMSTRNKIDNVPELTEKEKSPDLFPTTSSSDQEQNWKNISVAYNTLCINVFVTLNLITNLLFVVVMILSGRNVA